MKKRAAFIIIIGFAVLAILCSVYIVYKQSTNPLNKLFGKKQNEAANLDEAVKEALDSEVYKLNPISPGLRSSPSASTTVHDQKSTDILILGVDSRELQLESQTDMIMMLRIDDKNKIIKVITFSRDIYLSIPGFTDNRINEACVYGGPELVIKTINQAFDLDISYFIVFDFKTAEKMIDLIGSVSVFIDEEELKGINISITELNNILGDDQKADYLKNTGLQKLNGRQAISYARLRPNMGSDFVRMERQKEVLSSLTQSAKQIKPDQIAPLINIAFDTFYSNLSIVEFSEIAMEIYGIRDGLLQQYITVPVNNSYKEMQLVEMKYIVIDFQKNKDYISEFLKR